MVVRGCLGDTFWLSELSNEQLCQLRSNHMAPNLGCHNENLLVVNVDDVDDFLVDNHKVVLLTTHLKTFRQPFILCEALDEGCFNFPSSSNHLEEGSSK